MYIRLHVKYFLLLSNFNDRNFSRQFFKKLQYKIFYENSTSGSRGVTFGWTDRETDIKKVTVTFQNFARAQIRN